VSEHEFTASPSGFNRAQAAKLERLLEKQQDPSSLSVSLMVDA
jgi:hypothetical protein